MRRAIVSLVLLLPALWGSLSCRRPAGPRETLFIVRVDSIAVPDTISQADTLKIKLYGTIGNSGSYSFDHFEASRDSHSLHLTVWGKYTESDLATMVMVYLDGKEYPLHPVYPDRFDIFIRQPDNTAYRDSVAIR